MTEKRFYLTHTFQSKELAIAAVTQLGRQKIDAGGGRGSGGDRKP